MGDITSIGGDRDALKAKVEETYPKAKPGAIPVHAGQLYRFISEMQIGDLVVYPSKIDRRIHIGEVSGDYRHDPGLGRDSPNLRPVRWRGEYLRTRFSQGALYEIGSALTLFQVKNYADEFLAALAGATPISAESDEVEAGIVAEEIEATTRDCVLKRLALSLIHI